MIEDSVPLFQILVLLFRSRQDHSLVRTIDFEEDGIVAMRLILESTLIFQCLILVVREFGMNQMIEHHTRV